MVAASVLGLPRPDEYNIPAVGNNRRSQYYVLHDDGSFKYGYDTGDDAFESQKTDSDGDVDGRFGYTDSDGQEFNLQYTSGTGGFVARGAHIPQVHPDVAAAFEARRNDAPFVDPLADTDGDRSYNFDFDGEEHSRSEVSDSDGTVRGSYSYVDEFGRTRTYTYRAGKGIGFVIEGDDIPEQVQPLPSHTAAAAAHASQFGAAQSTRTAGHRGASHRGQASTSHSFSSTTRHQGTNQRASHHRAAQKPATTYFPPTPTTSNTRTSHSASSKFSSAVAPAVTRNVQSTTRRQNSFTNQRTVSRPQTSTFGTRQFEAANTRTSFSPSGRYSVAYETSSHSRQESGDDDNNVRGQFSFTADDDGEDRSVNYEASSATGFIATGKHLPIGPIVPGAPTGQVTGRIASVEEIEFNDPLADDDTDASFDFGFDSDSYSRSEVADEEGNVSGTYSVLGEDNILRTYRYRAGKGIGFETTEVSAVPSRNRASSTSSFNQGSSSSVSSSRRTSATGASSSTRTASVQAPATSYLAPQASGHASRAHTSFSSNTRGSSGHSTGGAHKFGGSSSFASTRTSSSGSRGSTHKFGGASHTSRSSSDEVFPGFTLRQYDPSEGRGKYGYVLKFDN